jgi:predicted peptidase
MKSFILLLYCILFMSALQAQSYEKEWFVAGGDSLPYRILYPEGYDAGEESFPLLLFLHGSGERGSDNEAQLTHGAQLFLDSSEQYPAIVVFPQCAKASYWAHVHQDSITKERSFPFYEKGKNPLELVIQLVDELLEKERVDRSRVWIAGLSMGGFGTFEILARRPNLFSKAIPICGGGNPRLIPLYADNTTFWIFHGDADSVVDVRYSRRMHKALQEAGADVRYTEYPGVDHNSWDNAFAEPQFLAWLFGNP